MTENKFEIFRSTEFGSVRTLETTDGRVLFCGADVAKALGYVKPNNAISAHCRYTLKQSIPHPQSADKQIEMTFIPEGDIYRLITHSKLPNAERFEAWVFDEVLPTIRKHGAYTATQPDYSALSPQLQYLISMEQKQKELETAVKTTNRRIDNMCEVMQVRGTNWRKATHSLVNRIASASHTDPREIYLDIYEEVEYRAGVNLSRRLENMADRLYERGASDSRISRLNNIDVIAEDKKLTEIYIAVTKEMAVKYNVC